MSTVLSMVLKNPELLKDFTGQPFHSLNGLLRDMATE